MIAYRLAHAVLLSFGLLITSPVAAQRERLSNAVNTDQYDESAPVFTADGKVMYFWSLDRPDGYGLQDIYFSNRDSLTGQWTRALNLGKPLNDPTCNIAFALTPDNTTMLVYRQGNSRTQTDLALSRRYPQYWGAPAFIKFDQFKNAAQSGITAYLGADSKTLLLSIIGPDSKGREDLYVSFYNRKTHAFSEPKNLGGIINTKGQEITPFLAPDGITLYFSSDSTGGSGMLDIFVTRRLDDTWQNWSTPLNLGPSINSPGDDYYFKFPADARFGYFVSNYNTPTKDIYRVRLPANVLPLPVMLVKGKVIDQVTKKPISAAITYQELPSGHEIGTANTDTTTGEYRILLPAGKLYGFLAMAPGAVAISENLEVRLPPGKTYDELTRDLFMAPLQTGQTIRLNNLFFETGSAVLNPNSYPELRRIADLLTLNPTLSIEVGGHTDNTGTTQVNLELSDARARAVKKYLEALKVDGSRVSVFGYGANFPQADNNTDEGRRRNRRVEMKIVTL